MTLAIYFLIEETDGMKQCCLKVKKSVKMKSAWTSLLSRPHSDRLENHSLISCCDEIAMETTVISAQNRYLFNSPQITKYQHAMV